MGWLTEFLQQLGKWFPRLYCIAPDSGGIRLTLGKHVQVLTPGWYVYWPILQEIRAIYISMQVVDLRPQSVITKDGKSLTISGGMRYRVVDAKKSILEVAEWSKSIQILALGLIAEYVSKHTYAELADLEKISNTILDGFEKEAVEIGMHIMDMYITDIGVSKNIRLFGLGEK